MSVLCFIYESGKIGAERCFAMLLAKQLKWLHGTGSSALTMFDPAEPAMVNIRQLMFEKRIVPYTGELKTGILPGSVNSAIGFSGAPSVKEYSISERYATYYGTIDISQEHIVASLISEFQNMLTAMEQRLPTMLYLQSIYRDVMRFKQLYYAEYMTRPFSELGGVTIYEFLDEFREYVLPKTDYLLTAEKCIIVLDYISNRDDKAAAQAFTEAYGYVSDESTTKMQMNAIKRNPQLWIKNIKDRLSKPILKLSDALDWFFNVEIVSRDDTPQEVKDAFADAFAEKEAYFTTVTADLVARHEALVHAVSDEKPALMIDDDMVPSIKDQFPLILATTKSEHIVNLGHPHEVWLQSGKLGADINTIIIKEADMPKLLSILGRFKIEGQIKIICDDTLFSGSSPWWEALTGNSK